MLTSEVKPVDASTVDPTELRPPKKMFVFDSNVFAHEAKKAMSYWSYLNAMSAEEVKKRALHDLKARAYDAERIARYAKGKELVAYQEEAQTYAKILTVITSTNATSVKDQMISKQKNKAQEFNAILNEVVGMKPKEITAWLHEKGINGYPTEDKYELRLTNHYAVPSPSTALHQLPLRQQESDFCNFKKMNKVSLGYDPEPLGPEVITKHQFELAKKIVISTLGDVSKRDARMIQIHHEEAIRVGFPWPKDSGVEATLVRLEQGRITRNPSDQKHPGKLLEVPGLERPTEKFMRKLGFTVHRRSSAPEVLLSASDLSVAHRSTSSISGTSMPTAERLLSTPDLSVPRVSVSSTNLLYTEPLFPEPDLSVPCNSTIDIGSTSESTAEVLRSLSNVATNGINAKTARSRMEHYP